MVVAAFNQEKALVGAFYLIVQLHRLIDLRHYCKLIHAVELMVRWWQLRGGWGGETELNEEETNVVKYSCFMLVREHIKCSLCLTPGLTQHWAGVW